MRDEYLPVLWKGMTVLLLRRVTNSDLLWGRGWPDSISKIELTNTRGEVLLSSFSSLLIISRKSVTRFGLKNEIKWLDVDFSKIFLNVASLILEVEPLKYFLNLPRIQFNVWRKHEVRVSSESGNISCNIDRIIQIILVTIRCDVSSQTCNNQ